MARRQPSEIESWRETPGPWQGEPDREEFVHAGLNCLLRRVPSGCWCGYVAVPPYHSAHGKPYDAIDVDVHGGLTYAEEGMPGEKPEDQALFAWYWWWFGFDCNHFDDVCPMIVAHLKDLGCFGTYKNIDYARNETRSLAEQLAQLAVEQLVKKEEGKNGE